MAKQTEDLHGVTDNRARNDCLWSALAPVRALPGVNEIDLDQYLCGTGDACDRIGPDTHIRYDGVHYTKPASVTLSDWLTPRILHAAATG